MKYLLMWLMTVCVSYGMELANELRYFKDIADNGYRVDFKKMNAKIRELNMPSPTINIRKYLIPFYNMFLTVQNTMNYINQRDMVFNSFKVLNCLEEMSEEEKREYAKKPTGLNAILIPLKMDLKLQKASKVVVRNENGEEGTIYFDFNDEKGFIILKTTGYVSKLSVDEQEKLVKMQFREIKKLIINEEYEKIKVEVLNKMNAINDAYDKADNTEDAELRRERVTQELIRLRKELLESVNEEDKEENKEGNNLIKKL